MQCIHDVVIERGQKEIAETHLSLITLVSNYRHFYLTSSNETTACNYKKASNLATFLFSTQAFTLGYGKCSRLNV